MPLPPNVTVIELEVREERDGVRNVPEVRISEIITLPHVLPVCVLELIVTELKLCVRTTE